MKHLFNLQRFATATIETGNTLVSTEPTYLNTNTTTSTGMSLEMKTFYDKNLLREAGPNLVHDQFGQKRNIPRGSGKTIEFRKYNPLPKAMTPLTEGITPNGNTPSVDHITATPAQYGDFIATSDVLEMTAIDNVITENTRILADQAGKTLDTITRNVMQSGTNVSYADKVVSGAHTPVTARADLALTAVLTPDEIVKASIKLEAQDTHKINGSYVGIIHPLAKYDLIRNPEFVDWHKYAKPEELYKGEIGEIGGVRFVVSTEAKIYRDATCPKIDSSISEDDATFSNRLAVFGTLIFGADAYATTEVAGGGLEMIVKQKGSAGTADPLDQRSTVGWKALKTAVLLAPNYIVRLEHCSAQYSATAKAN